MAIVLTDSSSFDFFFLLFGIHFNKFEPYNVRIDYKKKIW